MELFDFGKLVKKEALEDFAIGKDLDPETKKVVEGDPKSADEKERLFFRSILWATVENIREIAPATFHFELVKPAFLSLTLEDTTRYLTMLNENYQGSGVLYYTACAIWGKTMKDLGIDFSLDHIKIVHKKDTYKCRIDKVAMKKRPALAREYYRHYLSAVSCGYYMAMKKHEPDTLERVLAPSVNRLKEEDVEFVDKFVLITLCMLTSHLCDINVVDNKKINEWCKVNKLGPAETLEDVMASAESFFTGPQE